MIFDPRVTSHVLSLSPKKAANQRRWLNRTTSQTNGGIMSGLARWKENRIRQGIYLGHLKDTTTSFSRGGFNGVGNGAITLKYGGQP